MSPGQAADLEALQHIASAVHNAGSVDELWLAAEQVAREYLQQTGLTVLCLSDDGSLTPAWSTFVDTSEEGAAIGASMAEELLSPETRAFSPALMLELGDDTAPVAASTPLLYLGEPFGVAVLHPTGDRADSLDASRLEFFGVQLGAALFRLQLYDAACEEAGRNEQKLRAIGMISGLLRAMELERLLASLMESALDLTNAEAGSIALWDTGELRNQTEWGLTDEILAGMRRAAGGTLAEHAARSGETIFVADTAQDDTVDFGDLEERITSCMCVPLVSSGHAVGVVTLVNSHSGGAFTTSEVEILETIASFGAIAVENAILAEAAKERERLRGQLLIAREIQQELLPIGAPTMDHFDISAWTIPCDETGGDYFDFIEYSEDRVGLVVGDVVGHGIGAALLMATARAFLRALAMNSDDVGAVLTKLNSLLAADMSDEQFMTMLLGILEPTTNTFHYAAVGHDPPLVYRSDEDAFEDIDVGQFPLGIIPEAEFEAAPPLHLRPGDVMAICTDGVWEGRNEADEDFGKPRLKTVVQEHHAETAEQIAGHIRQAVVAFRGDAPQTDDLTVAVVKRSTGS